jgi:hypothetical protein
MKNIRKAILKLSPKRILPSRKFLNELSKSMNINEPEDKYNKKLKVVHKVTEDSWKKTVNLVHSAISINKKDEKLTPEIITQKLAENGFYIARLVGSSKSYYCTSHPQNVVFFNANLIEEKLGKVWFGDLDLTKDAPKLIKIAKELKTTFYVLRETDCRFNNENKSIKGLRKVSKWNTNQNIPVYDKDFKIVA